MTTYRQTLTEGGRLYGYRTDELTPHVRQWHHTDQEWDETTHLGVHEVGADHEHYRAETGALALSVKNPRFGGPDMPDEDHLEEALLKAATYMRSRVEVENLLASLRERSKDPKVKRGGLLDLQIRIETLEWVLGQESGLRT